MTALLGKLHTFQGRSRFTTWAFKFAILQAATEVRRLQWQHREVELRDLETSRHRSTRVPSSTPRQPISRTPSPAPCARVLTPYQRRIAVALLVDGGPHRRPRRAARHHPRRPVQDRPRRASPAAGRPHGRGPPRGRRPPHGQGPPPRHGRTTGPCPRPTHHHLGRHRMSTTPPTRPASLTPAAVDALLRDTTPWLSCEDCFERMDTYVEALLHDPEHRDPAMAGAPARMRRLRRGGPVAARIAHRRRVLARSRLTPARRGPGPPSRPHDDDEGPCALAQGPSSWGGAEGIRTPDPLHAMEVRYQLRYSPEWVSPEGATASLPMHPRPAQIGLRVAGDPARDATSGGRVPRLDPPPGAALDELGPVAVAQGAEHPPGEVVLQPEQPGGGGAARRTVRGDDEALPRPAGPSRCSVSAAPTRSATSATVSPWSPRRASSPRARAVLHLGPPVGDLRGGQALPGRPRRSRGSAGPASTGMPHARPTLSAVSRARVRSEETMRSGERAAIAGPTASACSMPALGQRGVEVALPDAGGVVVGLAVPQHDDAPGRRPGDGGAHRPPCSVPTTPRSIVGQSFQSRSSS